MVKNLLLENLPVSRLRRDEAARRKTRSKKTKTYNCSVPWTKSERILGKIRTRNSEFYRSGAAEFLPQTPSFRRALAWAGEFFAGVLWSLPLPHPSRARARHRNSLNILYDNLEYNTMEYKI